MSWENATIIAREDLTPELSIFRIRPDSAEPLKFEPGQYAEIGFPRAQLSESGEVKIERRSYSIASSPKEPGIVELYVVEVQGGEITPRLFALKTGDRIWIGPKIKGKFVTPEMPLDGQNVVMVATGTGLAPFVSMMRAYRSIPRWNKCVLFHGVRHASDFGYEEELRSFEESCPWFRYVPVASREPETSAWRGERGRVTEFFTPERFEKVANFVLKPESTQVMLCGNPDMIDQINATLQQQGFVVHKRKTPGQIHFERYW